MKKFFSSIKNTKGFTLIELLIVVAIIGILSAVVLTSLGSARDKAKVAKTKSEMSSLRAQAELYTGGTNGSGYGPTSTSCTSGIFSNTANSGLGTLMASILVSGSGHACASDDNKWAVSLTLPGTTNGTWCVDSNGSSKNTVVSSTTGLCS